MSIKLSLIDNDSVAQAKTVPDLDSKENLFSSFFRDVGEEPVTGKIPYLEIEDPKTGSLTLEVSKFD